jgi:hypothetical protein
MGLDRQSLQGLDQGREGAPNSALICEIWERRPEKASSRSRLLLSWRKETVPSPASQLTTLSSCCPIAKASARGSIGPFPSRGGFWAESPVKRLEVSWMGDPRGEAVAGGDFLRARLGPGASTEGEAHLESPTPGERIRSSDAVGGGLALGIQVPSSA